MPISIGVKIIIYGKDNSGYLARFEPLYAKENGDATR